MLKTKLLIVTVLLFSLFYLSYGGWICQTVDNNGSVGKYTSLALDSEQNPHISYWNEGLKSLKYAYYDGSNWIIDEIDKGYIEGFTSLALTSANEPRISYYRYASGYSLLMYAHKDSGSWEEDPVDGGDGSGTGTYNAIALRTDSTPAISYRNGGDENLCFTKLNGATWNKESIDTEGNVGEYTSLVLDNQDHPHISYFDGTNGALKYANWTGSSWDIVTVDTGGVGEWTAIALDSSGYPHISYYDYTMKNLKYASFNGTDWVKETIESAGDVGSYCSLAIDSTNKPHISYYDVSHQVLKYAYNNGSYWHIQNADISSNCGRYSSIKTDSANHPHISYYDVNNQDLRYCYRVEGSGAIAESLSATSMDGFVVLKWFLNSSSCTNEVYRREISSVENNWQLIARCPELGLGSQEYQDYTIESEKKYSYTVKVITVSGESELLGPVDVVSSQKNAIRLSLSKPVPNPAIKSCQFSYSKSGSSPAVLMITDIKGCLIRLERLNSASTSGCFDWDLCSSTGEKAAPGVYCVRLLQQNNQSSTRVVIAR